MCPAWTDLGHAIIAVHDNIPELINDPVVDGQFQLPYFLVRLLIGCIFRCVTYRWVFE